MVTASGDASCVRACSRNACCCRNYLTNDDIVWGWIWHAHVSGPGSERTCPACWAMHGSKHKLEERLTDHICGRCAMVPDVVSWDKLGVSGFAGADVAVATGPELSRAFEILSKTVSWARRPGPRIGLARSSWKTSLACAKAGCGGRCTMPRACAWCWERRKRRNGSGRRC